MTSDSIDLPSPAFRAHLEWEIARTFRREARLGTQRQRTRRRRIRGVLTVAVCLALGTGSNFAAAQVRDDARRDSLLDAARADLQMAALRQSLAQARFSEVARQASSGVASPRELESAALDLHMLQARIARLQVNIAEIQAAAQPPRDELTAPLVGGRDFVRQRLEVDLDAAQQQLAVAEHSLADVERLRQVDMVSDVDRADKATAVRQAEEDFAVLARKLALRREFLDKATPADQIARQLEAVQVREQFKTAQQELDVAQMRLAALERERKAGATAELDVMRAQVDAKERELLLQRLAQQLKRVGEGHRDSLP